MNNIDTAYKMAQKGYASYGVDTELVIKKLSELRISLHCWQADDVSGFETADSELGGGGIQVTGNYPGKATNIKELRADIEKAISLIGSKKNLNLHAIYGDFGGEFIDRDKIEPKHFSSWIEWAKERGVGLDFNPTCFSHPKADSGFTLSSKDETVRQFWVEHVKRCRAIANEIGRELGVPCVNNIWIPDGSKDTPVDRGTHRAILKKSLDEIFEVEYPKENIKDAVESKLFGIGSESMVVGSHDFYLGYAIKNNKLICLDNGHFHPTEQIGDKISSVSQFVDEILLHVTRGVRWDSDHVVTFNEEITLIAQEVIRNSLLDRVYIGLDFFDASINRIGAYVVGARATQKAFLFAMLEPTDIIKEYEESGRNFERLALLEEMKSMPWGDVWREYLRRENTPLDSEIIEIITEYEKSELLNR